MRESLHVFWELVLVVGSIFIFRSVWMILDKSFGSGSLWFLLLFGFALCVPALYVLNNHMEKEYVPRKR